jgi:hypothetical protein
MRRRFLYSSPVTQLVFDQSISDPANITGAGTGAIVDILAKMRRCLCKKTAEGEVTICYLDNNNSNYYEDGSGAMLNGIEGDVMVYKPAFWYKYVADPLGTNQSYGYNLSEKEISGGIYSPESLIGAYKSYISSYKLYSRSGVAPSASISMSNNMRYAKARGAYYNIIDFEQHCMIALLFYAKSGTRDSQAVLGTGNASYGAMNGTTNSIGNADTVGAAYGHASFAGIEGVHGCINEWIGGISVDNAINVWTITNLDGSIRGVKAAATTTSSFIKEIAAAKGPYFDVIPIDLGGTNTNYFTDYFYYGTGGNRAFARSMRNDYKEGGVSYVFTNNSPEGNGIDFASRLAFRGIIREAESVQAFKALQLLS